MGVYFREAMVLTPLNVVHLAVTERSVLTSACMKLSCVHCPPCLTCFVITSHPLLLSIPSGIEDFFEITDYLMQMEKTNIYNLGLVLGLSQHKVRAMIDSKTFLDDIVTAWLRKEDLVSKRGEPSWTVLVSALKHPRVGQTGIASIIEKDKGLGLWTPQASATTIDTLGKC